MKRILFLAIALLVANALAAQYKIIVNSDNNVSSLTKKEVSDMFLKKAIKWSEGTEVTPIDQKESSGVRASFTGDVHNKDVKAIKSYWQQYVFSGKGTPPTEKSSDSEIVSYVKSNKGAIGYVSLQADVSGVKVITLK